MKSQIWLGDRRIAAPTFTIGDCVVSVLDAERRDELDPRPRIFEWFRGVITGCYYVSQDQTGNQWRDEGWVYMVRMIDCYTGGHRPTWTDEAEEFCESELKRSHYTPRYFRFQRPPPPFLPPWEMEIEAA